MTNTNDEVAKVIDLVPRLKKRSAGACMDQKSGDRIDPKDDLVIAVAMELLKTVREEIPDHPLHVLTAVQVVTNTLTQQYIRHYGKEEFTKMVHSAAMKSRMYEAHYSGEDNG